MNATEVVRAYYQAFNEKNWDRFLGFLAEDVVHGVNQGPEQLGKAKFASFMAEMNRCYEEKVVELELFAGEHDTRVAAEFFIEGTYLSSQPGLPDALGQKYRLRVGAFFEIQNRQVKRITNYYNLPEWVQQVQKH